MPLTRRAMLERDVEAYERVLSSAFSKGILRLMYPHGESRKDRDHSIESVLKKLRDPASIYNYQVVIDTDAKPVPSDIERLSREDRQAAFKEGKIAGIAVWRTYERERTDEEIKAEAEARDKEGIPPGMDASFCEDFFGTIARCKKDIIGHRAYVLCDILATDPAYHRRGIGGMQLQWGLDHADKLGLPAYLEASKMGQPLYERYGFDSLKVMPFDWTKYGVTEETEQMDLMLMLRPIKNPTNGTKD